jgi:hypothetical protein
MKAVSRWICLSIVHRARRIRSASFGVLTGVFFGFHLSIFSSLVLCLMQSCGEETRLGIVEARYPDIQNVVPLSK